MKKITIRVTFITKCRNISYKKSIKSFQVQSFNYIIYMIIILKYYFNINT